MTNPINNSQPTSQVHEAPQAHRKPEPQAQTQKSGALSHDQVTLTNSQQVNRDEESRE